MTDSPEPPESTSDAAPSPLGAEARDDDTEATEAAPEKLTGRRVRHVAIVVGGLVVALLAVLVIGGQALDWWASEPAAPAASPTPEPTESPTPSPFAGTPAEHFAEGADGIVLPSAEPIGEFTAEEVADALDQVRQALIAARLDPAVLVDHDLDPFLSLMAPSHQEALRSAIEADALGPFPSRVAPHTPLAPVAVRVAGYATYQFAIVGPPDAPILEVVTRFVWAYPFQAGLVVVRDELAWEVRLGRPWGESSLGPWLADGASSIWGVDCDDRSDSLLRPAPGSAAIFAAEADLIFDPEQPLESVGGC